MFNICLPLLVSILSILFAFFLAIKIKKAPAISEKAIEIDEAIREGAKAFLKREYKTVAIVAIILFLFFGVFLDFKIAIGFLLGAFASALAGAIGMTVSTLANLKVAEAAKEDLKKAFDLSFKGGSVTGFLVVGLALLIISLFYLFTNDLEALVALGFGCSLISLFARLGGGIYTKAADVGADLVGKIEKQIPEDDPRNPAVIADQVGDNVGDCAGMAADLFETFVVTIVAAIVLGKLIFPKIPEAVFLPLSLASFAILASIFSTFFVKLKNKNIVFALFKSLILAGVFSAILFYFPISRFSLILNQSLINLYLPSIFGLLIAGGIFLITDFFTSKRYSPVRSIALASQTGHAPNIIQGLAVGMKSTILPIILISIGILISFWLSGMYGLAICVVSMLSLTGLIITIDSYGPITDNASGIAEMAGFPKEVREKTDALDAVGNTTKATTKGFAIASAGLAALVLFSAFVEEFLSFGKKIDFILEDPEVLVGLFSGGILAYFFSALALEAVGKTAQKVVEEVRRQFREIKGLMEGKEKPQYSRCVDIVTKAALKEMIFPTVITIIFPILVGFLLGPKGLGGLLIGAIVVGIFLALKMATGGAAWDNAKKWIEEGNLGGKGSFAHQAAVTGDTVGDPYKDTAGPAINPMIKVVNIVALLIAKFLI
jgi:K(+)-stimulated pyrophosphate-energized sodium pump